ncbi:MAG: Phenylalanine-tRNA ligase beta subunit [Candidatus Giovannonibacteria bacterium GW2011_GWA2_53_7]|uniref:phenylalanine--tRNA ligase n=1 Tax=Candidatus Giovannonibacteria bacterium GW2011_GWA2_53_7 TaxID=1618650 RepID=A0A0G1XTX4_9BACT|nr:MAG: Phenylalanine-tRNA ligase beta subunit [Candidatus Giovannonibacteria bacterium GW2011_GWA2_53_7]
MNPVRSRGSSDYDTFVVCLKSFVCLQEIISESDFHAFEIDSIVGDVLDVKVLPNRVADCNSEAGLARELSAILEIPTTLPRPSGSLPPVTVSLAQINGILGSDFSQSEVEDVFKRLGLDTKIAGAAFTVTPPASRPDLIIAEDLVEEVGRILGYDRVLPTELPPLSGVSDQARFRGIERMKDSLIEQGFTEVSTQSFVTAGDITLANPLDQTRPALRTSLEENLQEVLARAKQYEALILPPKQKLKLFEVGSVFPKEGEYLELRMTERVPEWGDSAGISDNLTIAKLEDYGKDYAPKKYTLGAYKPFSLYPFIVRDIALWVPVGTESGTILEVIRKESGTLLVRSELFDTFSSGGGSALGGKKKTRISYAFRLVLQSFETGNHDSRAIYHLGVSPQVDWNEC